MRDIKIMFIDTETSGLVDMRTPYDDLNQWPHVVQLAYTICLYNPTSKQLVPVDKKNFYFKPIGFSMDAEAEKVNRLSDSYLMSYGTTPDKVYPTFLADFRSVDACCAHNAVFDMKMIKAELMRLSDETHMREVPWIDTMYQGQQYLKRIGKPARWPKLAALYKELYGKDPDADYNLHNATSDVEVMIEVFKGLVRAGLYDESHLTNLYRVHATKPNARLIDLNV